MRSQTRTIEIAHPDIQMADCQIVRLSVLVLLVESALAVFFVPDLQ